jgi:hypothetical protein
MDKEENAKSLDNRAKNSEEYSSKHSRNLGQSSIIIIKTERRAYKYAGTT